MRTFDFSLLLNFSLLTSNYITQGHPWLACPMPPHTSHQALWVYLKEKSQVKFPFSPGHLLPPSSSPSLALPQATAILSMVLSASILAPYNSVTSAFSSHSLCFVTCIRSRSLAQNSSWSLPSYFRKIQTSYITPASLPRSLSPYSPPHSLQVGFLLP